MVAQIFRINTSLVAVTEIPASRHPSPSAAHNLLNPTESSLTPVLKHLVHTSLSPNPKKPSTRKYRTMRLFNILAAASVANAHTIFVSLEVDGQNLGVSNGVRTPTYDGPIMDVTSQSLACNGDPNPTMSTNTVIDVKAGSTVTAIWRHTLDSGPENVMDPSHVGPTIAYLKKVDDAKTAAGPGDGWFKIQEDGYQNGVWGTSKVIQNGGKHEIKIPDCIEDGQYLLRAEMIALHGAGTYPGAQFYMECAQLNIVGGSGSASPQTHAIPGIYSVRIHPLEIKTTKKVQS